MKKYLVQTFGCQMNVHDSERIEETLAAAGWSATGDPREADLVLFNTCSVREKAEQKLLSILGTFRDWKATRPHGLLAVAGCVAQQESDALLRRVPFLDLVVGPDNIVELPALLDAVSGGAPPIARTEFDVDAPSFLTTRPRAGAAPVSAFVTVMKGCDERCTYCIVPHTRGPERYRTATEIVDEVARVVDAGTREVTLLGQTVNSWFDPTGPLPTAREKATDASSRFAELLESIARQVPTLARLRYTSPHPRHVTEPLLRAHRELDVLAEHVHLPVQSGSDEVLRRMLRRYRRDEYISRALALRGSRNGLTLSTDIIVGFPGETRADFESTLSLVREVGFVAAFGFKYSPRPYTPALKLEDDVPEAEKDARLAELFEVVEAQQRAHLATLVGTRARVLVEGASRDGSGRSTGRTQRNEIVHFETGGRDATGHVVEVEIEKANKHSLVARAVGEIPEAPRAVVRARGVRLPVLASAER